MTTSTPVTELTGHKNKNLTDNLTGGQIQEVLDMLINQAVGPIIRCSSAFDLQIVHVLGATARNKKRKLSSLPREESIDLMCQFLSSEDADAKIQMASAMKLERSFFYNFVVRFLKEVDGYQKLYVKWLRAKSHKRKVNLSAQLAAIENNVSADRKTLWSSVCSAEDYLGLAYTFRNTIVLHYVRHAYKEAKAFVKVKGKNYDFNDVYQNFLAAVTKAVDKYDSSKGALTSYINWWLLNAKTTSNSLHGHEYGVAYSIPQLQKKAHAEKSSKAKQVNFGISLDKLVGSGEDRKELVQYIEGDWSVEEELLSNEEVVTIRALAKSVDPKGIARLYLDLDEVFSMKEKRQMVTAMQSQLGITPARDDGGNLVFVELDAERVKQHRAAKPVEVPSKKTDKVSKPEAGDSTSPKSSVPMQFRRRRVLRLRRRL